MLDEPKMKNWARSVTVLAAALLGVSLIQAAPSGLAFTSGKDRMSFSLKAAFVTVAFDIGQECSKSNSAGRVA